MANLMNIDKKKYIEGIKKLHRAYDFKEDIDSFVNRFITMQERRGNKFI
jgi:hypothetical protein